ncbi:hypothetical protein C0995_008165 [Termitomyces sp. Mi166|nr:hypothetical protein C0995_008165 [Termitomyces sp. Mi166\
MASSEGQQTASDILAQKAYFMAAYTLLVYDYFLTLPAEILQFPLEIVPMQDQICLEKWKDFAVYALSGKNIYLALIFIFHILAQLGLAFYIMSRGGAYLALALSFDAFVFIATIIATFNAARQFHAKPWLRVIQRDGILYFMAIFSSTLLWVLFGGLARNAGSIEDKSPHPYLVRKRGSGADMELQVIVSQQVISVVQ